MGWLTRNWHLKLAALGLATILYTGFVYSGSFTDQLFPGLPIEAINQPSGAFPLTQQLGTVDVQYRLSADAPERVTADSFAVTVDLAGYDMERSPELQSLPVRVTSLQQGVEALEFQPTTVPVALDQLGGAQVRVEVETGDRAGGPGHQHAAHQPRGGDRQRPAEPAGPRGPRRRAGPDLRVGHRRPAAAGAAGAGRHRRTRGGVGGAGAGHHPGRDRRARGRDEQDRADPADAWRATRPTASRSAP